jgi:chemotaxis protein methyltransferase CheR
VKAFPVNAAAKVERLRADVASFEALSLKLRVMEKHEIEDYKALLKHLNGGGPLVAEFIAAMTTHTTEFFREPRHFERLSLRIKDYFKNKSELRIWCAAASSGQEVYSLLIALFEAEPGLNGANVKVLATDIDLKVLERASLGVYSEAEMASLNPLYRQRYFRKQKSKQNLQFIVASSLRDCVTFAPFNLMNPTYPFQKRFDIIFCRNVLIYFDRETAIAVTGRLAEVLQPEGFLCVGHSEVGLVRTPLLKAEDSAFYRRIAD